MSRQAFDKLPPLYLITDRKLTPSGLLPAIESALKGGVRMLQLREKELSADELKSLAQEVLKLARDYGARLLINGAPELAADIGADGVQLGVNSTGIRSARQIIGQQALIGYSAHSNREVEMAAKQGADFVTFSPIYPTASKAQYGAPKGLKALRDVCRGSKLPVYALGGIDATRVAEVLDAGASGVALISAIIATADPAKNSALLLQNLQNPVPNLRDYS